MPQKYRDKEPKEPSKNAQSNVVIIKVPERVGNEDDEMPYSNREGWQKFQAGSWAT